MTALEQFELEYERTEEANDMHFSTYFIPSYYQPLDTKENTHGNT